MDILWTSNSEYASVGINHIKFWRIENNQMKMQRGKLDFKYGPQRIVCCALNKKDVLAGTVGGNLLVWKRPTETPTLYNISKSDKNEKAGSLDSISVTEQNIFIAGKEGIIHVMTNSYVDVLKIHFAELNPDSLSLKIRALDTTDEGKRIVLGTSASEIYELVSHEMKVSANSRYNKIDINKAPFTLNSIDLYYMNGLAVFKTSENAGRFATCSDDGLLRIWSAEEKRMIGLIELNTNSKGEIVINTDDSRLRCLALSPKEDMIAIGCKSGAIRIINVKEMRQV